MSATLLGPYTAGFSATSFFGPVGVQTDTEFTYQVRPTVAAVANFVTVTFSWVDENGVARTHVAPTLSLASLINTVGFNSGLIRLGVNEELSVAASMIGTGGEFEILYSRRTV